MNEQWLDIPGYEGYYMASSFGRILSVKRVDTYGRTVKERILYSGDNNNGYLQCSLSKDGVTKTYKVHRLITMAFHGMPEPGQEVNHKDDDRLNNKPDNLEWVTRKQNISQIKPRCGVENPRAKLTEDQVKYIRESEEGPRSLARRMGISHSTIVSVRIKRTWKHV